jgi:hypothetical protein
MLLWMITAGAGLYLLVAGRPGRPVGPPVADGADGAAVTEAAEAMTPVTVPASRPAQAGIPPAAAEALAAGARVPPITHTRIATQPGQHPLLEFMHPALGIVGLGIWIAYVATKFSTFAWVSFGILLATITAGLTWYTANRRQAAVRSRRASELLETSGAPGTAGVLVTREVRGPEAEAAGADTSGAGAHGPGARGAGARGAGTSGAGTSGAGTSGAGTSGAGASGAGASGAGASGAGTFGAGASGAGVSGAGVSGAVARRYPPRRILVHGSAAGTTLVLAIITLLVSVHS